MTMICPTVTATDITEYNRQLQLVSELSSRIHIDLMDGLFVPTKTPDVNIISALSSSINDFHLMYENPAFIIDELIKLNPNLVILHPESKADIPLLATKLRESNIKAGIALLPETTVESVQRLLPHVQHALIFGGKLGYHGGQADLSQLAKASDLKKVARHLELAWDGGANMQNVGQIKEAGIDVINVGGAIHGAPSPKEAYRLLTAEIKLDSYLR